AQRLQAGLDESRSTAPPTNRVLLPPRPYPAVPTVETGIDRTELERIFDAHDTIPEGFTLHPKLARQFDARREMWRSGEVDWGVGEALAFGTILAEGTDIRFAGQDTRRGTFSHRHSVLVSSEERRVGKEGRVWW